MMTKLKRLKSVAATNIRGRLGPRQWLGGTQPVTQADDHGHGDGQEEHN
jgi:hypothetical protein